MKGRKIKHIEIFNEQIINYSFLRNEFNCMKFIFLQLIMSKW